MGKGCTRKPESTLWLKSGPWGSLVGARLGGKSTAVCTTERMTERLSDKLTGRTWKTPVRRSCLSAGIGAALGAGWMSNKSCSISWHGDPSPPASLRERR